MVVKRYARRQFRPLLVSGVAGPLAARGGGQICRPFVLGFGNWREPDAAEDPML